MCVCVCVFSASPAPFLLPAGMGAAGIVRWELARFRNAVLLGWEGRVSRESGGVSLVSFLFIARVRVGRLPAAGCEHPVGRVS